MPPGERFANPLTERLIGIEVRAATVSHRILPGLEVRERAIPVDAVRPHCPVDSLHEAGHLAVVGAAERDAPVQFCGMSCEPRMAAGKGVAPFPHTLRRLR